MASEKGTLKLSLTVDDEGSGAYLASASADVQLLNSPLGAACMDWSRLVLQEPS